MSRLHHFAFSLFAALIAFGSQAQAQAQGAHEALIAKHAAANGVPESLVRRVIRIESTGNPRLISKGNYGLMQIRLGTAKSMGYAGDAEGLLDADTNMTYAVKYLAGAYRLAGGDENRAVGYYQRGYYGEPKSKVIVVETRGPVLASVSSRPVELTDVAIVPKPVVAQQQAVIAHVAEREARVTKRAEHRDAATTASRFPMNILAYMVEKGMTQEDKDRLRKRSRHVKAVAAR